MPEAKLTEVRHWLKSVKDVDHFHHDSGEHGAHEHLGATHSSHIHSFSVRINEEIDWAAFGVWLTAVLHRHGDKILRVKGLLNVADALGPVVLNGVQHVIFPPVHLEEWPDNDRASRLVFVVQGIEPAAVGRSLTKFLLAARPADAVASSQLAAQLS